MWGEGGVWFVKKSRVQTHNLQNYTFEFSISLILDKILLKSHLNCTSVSYLSGNLHAAMIVT
jgi:hypothetical protein